MRVEVLFPELCALYGDHGNILFLEQALGEENIIKTSILDKPKFISEAIDLIYIGAMSEKTQLWVLDILRPYRDLLKEKLDAGMKALFTGNAMDLLGTYIVEEDASRIEALNLFAFETVLKRNPRLNDTILGTDASGLLIIGHKTQFTQSYGNNSKNYFIKTEIGMGINKETQLEGFVYKGLVATNLTGPLLVLNPDFAQAYLGLEISFEEALMRAKHKKIADIRKYYHQ